MRDNVCLLTVIKMNLIEVSQASQHVNLIIVLIQVPAPSWSRWCSRVPAGRIASRSPLVCPVSRRGRRSGCGHANQPPADHRWQFLTAVSGQFVMCTDSLYEHHWQTHRNVDPGLVT